MFSERPVCDNTFNIPQYDDECEYHDEGVGECTCDEHILRGVYCPDCGCLGNHSSCTEHNAWIVEFNSLCKREANK